MKKSKEMEHFYACLEIASPSDFDGHTEFDRLTAEERLLWLSQCARFIHETNTSK